MNDESLAVERQGFLDTTSMGGALVSRAKATRRVIGGAGLTLVGGTVYGLGVSGLALTSFPIVIGGWCTAAAGLTLFGSAAVHLFRYGRRYPAILLASLSGLGVSALLSGLSLLYSFPGFEPLYVFRAIGGVSAIAFLGFAVLLPFLVIGALARWLGGADGDQ